MEYMNTKKEKQLKFTNPIRDYKHLMVNRFVHELIKLQALVDDKTYTEIPNQTFHQEIEKMP
jgi:hypothetical protein